MAALPGMANPRVSATQAIVDAVPMTAQVPAVVASLLSTSRISLSVIESDRYSAQNLLQSVQAPRRSPLYLEVIIGPPTNWTAGRLAETAPINWAGMVLSQPPIRTTASIGWALIISSVSIDIRLRYFMLVGFRKISPREMVGNSRGKAPLAITPRLTASRSSGKCL